MDANWTISETTLWQDSDSVVLWHGRYPNFGQRFEMTSDSALTESHVRLSSKHDSQYPPSANRIICYSIYQRWERWSSSKFGKGSQKADFSKYVHWIYIVPYPEKDYEHSFFNTLLWKKPQLKEGLSPLWRKYWYSSGDTIHISITQGKTRRYSVDFRRTENVTLLFIWHFIIPK